MFTGRSSALVQTLNKNNTIAKCKITPYSHAYNPQFFCSDCGVQNLVRILNKTPNFRLFCKIRRSLKPMTIAKMIDNELQTA